MLASENLLALRVALVSFAVAMAGYSVLLPSFSKESGKPQSRRGYAGPLPGVGAIRPQRGLGVDREHPYLHRLRAAACP